ncbi:hypothetical protein KGF54_000583 [Candida jiufengensis]|uniref:uncharacterized protein n=1 Tax=Candida jiufengensis TaxID=497108 RepID=UPI0022257558|nr:uncharacterized protein KGF54_000583 [Candida jiufengensis]KAI5956964.1 hypothetical protein KGF54_000583 [Candida jiufengensis]
MTIIIKRSLHLLKNRGLLRYYSNINVPFQDDLSDIDLDDFGLSDFKHYKESTDVIEQRKKLYQSISEEVANEQPITSLESIASAKEPSIYISKLTDPYINLSIEDYIYNKMPLSTNFNSERLMFYTNSPCVVIGKNQNPWKEVNLPVLNSLGYPLIRRKSGGGTVVHDLGNVNFSFMTTKQKFDRFKFVNLVVDSINQSGVAKKIEVNKRGDIVTIDQNQEFKISGSAYKLSKGKSYHHSTMLLNSNLKNLSKILHRDERKLGVVEAKNSIASVKSKVTNLEIDSDKFIKIVSNEFKQEYGINEQTVKEEESEEVKEFDEFNEMMGLTDFINSIKTANVFEINSSTQLPQEVIDTSEELKNWNWKFGHTPIFNHYLLNDKLGLKLKFYVEKGKIVQIDWELEKPNNELQSVLKNFEKGAAGKECRGDLIKESLGSDDELSKDLGKWLSKSIDGL